MNESTMFLAALGVVFAIVFLVGFVKTPTNSVAALKARYHALSRVAKHQAESDLHDRLVALAERFPGKTERWYLQWLVTDLERAKR